MNNKEILTIIALSSLGLCLLLGLAKMAMKSDKAKKGCDNACSLLVFVAVVLVAVSQLLADMDPYMTVPPNYYYDTDKSNYTTSESECEKKCPRSCACIQTGVGWLCESAHGDQCNHGA
jgi:hypothetical protein